VPYLARARRSVVLAVGVLHGTQRCGICLEHNVRAAQEPCKNFGVLSKVALRKS
jgi:hypothetical protein